MFRALGLTPQLWTAETPQPQADLPGAFGRSLEGLVHPPWKRSLAVILHPKCTLPETNIAPENEWLEDEFPFGMAYFQRRTVGFRECRFWFK